MKKLIPNSYFTGSCDPVIYKRVTTVLVFSSEAVTRRFKGFLKNFAKFTGKHLCQSLFLNKVVTGSGTLLKKRLWYRCFHLNFAKFLKTPSVTEHLLMRASILSLTRNK